MKHINIKRLKVQSEVVLVVVNIAISKFVDRGASGYTRPVITLITAEIGRKVVIKEV